MRFINRLLAGVGGGTIVGGAIYGVVVFQDGSQLAAWLIAGAVVGGVSVVIVTIASRHRGPAAATESAEPVSTTSPGRDASQTGEAGQLWSLRPQLGAAAGISFAAAILLLNGAADHATATQAPGWLPDFVFFSLSTRANEALVGSFMGLAVVLSIGALAPWIARKLDGTAWAQLIPAVTLPVSLGAAHVGYASGLAARRTQTAANIYVIPGFAVLLALSAFILIEWWRLVRSMRQPTEDVANTVSG